MTDGIIAIASPGGLGGRYHGPGMALSRPFGEAVAEGRRIVVLHGQGPEYRCDFEMQDCGDAAGAKQFAWALRARMYLSAHREQVALLQTATLFTAPFLAALAARSLGIPAFGRVAALGSDVRPLDWRRSTSLSLLRRRLLNRLDGVVALSHDIRQELLETGLSERKIFLIPNAVDTVTFRPASAEERAALRWELRLDTSFLVVGCGGVTPRKGVKEAIAAVGELAAHGNTETTLVWIGPIDDDSYRRVLLATAAEMRIADRVILTGYQADVSRWLRAADAFVLPSENESMPNALLEAMACGLPVLATPVSGARDVIRHGENGMLISRDPKEIADTLLRVIRNSELRTTLGSNARRDIQNGYQPRQIWRMYREMYEQCGVVM